MKITMTEPQTAEQIQYHNRFGGVRKFLGRISFIFLIVWAVADFFGISQMILPQFPAISFGFTALLLYFTHKILYHVTRAVGYDFFDDSGKLETQWLVAMPIAISAVMLVASYEGSVTLIHAYVVYRPALLNDSTIVAAQNAQSDRIAATFAADSNRVVSAISLKINALDGQFAGRIAETQRRKTFDKWDIARRANDVNVLKAQRDGLKADYQAAKAAKLDSLNDVKANRDAFLATTANTKIKTVTDHNRAEDDHKAADLASADDWAWGFSFAMCLLFWGCTLWGCRIDCKSGIIPTHNHTEGDGHDVWDLIGFVVTNIVRSRVNNAVISVHNRAAVQFKQLDLGAKALNTEGSPTPPPPPLAPIGGGDNGGGTKIVAFPPQSYAVAAEAKRPNVEASAASEAAEKRAEQPEERRQIGFKIGQLKREPITGPLFEGVFNDLSAPNQRTFVEVFIESQHALNREAHRKSKESGQDLKDTIWCPNFYFHEELLNPTDIDRACRTVNPDIIVTRLPSDWLFKGSKSTEDIFEFFKPKVRRFGDLSRDQREAMEERLAAFLYVPVSYAVKVLAEINPDLEKLNDTYYIKGQKPVWRSICEIFNANNPLPLTDDTYMVKVSSSQVRFLDGTVRPWPIEIRSLTGLPCWAVVRNGVITELKDPTSEADEAKIEAYFKRPTLPVVEEKTAIVETVVTNDTNETVVTVEKAVVTGNKSVVTEKQPKTEFSYGDDLLKSLKQKFQKDLNNLKIDNGRPKSIFDRLISQSAEFDKAVREVKATPKLRTEICEWVGENVQPLISEYLKNGKEVNND